MLHESRLHKAQELLAKLDDLRGERRILGHTPALHWEVQYWSGNALVKLRTHQLPCDKLAALLKETLTTRIAAVAAELRAMDVEVNADV